MSTSAIFHLQKVEYLGKELPHITQEELLDLVEVADCVNYSNYFHNDFAWLCEAKSDLIIGEINKGAYYITIKKEDLEKHFKEKINNLKEKVNDLEVRDFQYMSPKPYLLQKLIEDNKGFYIAESYETDMSVDNFDKWLTIVYYTMEKNNIKKITWRVVETFSYYM